MRVICAGSRTIDDYFVVQYCIEQSGFEISKMLSGCCRGVDRRAEEWAKLNRIPIDPYPANWDKYGKKAGPIRNGIMADRGDALIAILDKYAENKGTRNMIACARWYNLRIALFEVDTKDLLRRPIPKCIKQVEYNNEVHGVGPNFSIFGEVEKDIQ